jgi:hypothetical protein
LDPSNLKETAHCIEIAEKEKANGTEKNEKLKRNGNLN